MKLFFSLVVLFAFPIACFGSIHLVENPETEALIVFPENHSFQQKEFEGGVTYSAGGLWEGERPCNWTVHPSYQFTINWDYSGLPDKEILDLVMLELKELDLYPYYIYSYGKSGQSENSERLLAKNATDKIQIAIIVKNGIVYRIQTNEKLPFTSWLDCSMVGLPGDHDGFLNSLKLKK